MLFLLSMTVRCYYCYHDNKDRLMLRSQHAHYCSYHGDEGRYAALNTVQMFIIVTMTTTRSGASASVGALFQETILWVVTEG